MKKSIFAFFAFCILSVSAFAEVNIASCTGCHGAHFEKRAMGASKIVSNMSNDDIFKALTGYQSGLYGGHLKTIMEKQMAKYSPEDLKKLRIGKDIFIEAKITDKVFYSENNKFAYKEKDQCWVVDYKKQKSNLVDCKVIDGRLQLKTDDLLPPYMPGLPSALFQNLFK